MTADNVVVVESPAKAKTINKYLGKDYVVVASYGHVRDLPPKDGSVDPEQDFAMRWELGDRAGKPVQEIARAMKGASRLYLATDPDREGEAISWHVAEILREKNLLKDKELKRVTFSEITQRAVNQAFQSPRGLDENLIQAYLARRALDYLVGFTLSPVLWRKLPGSKSAGRVQSVALRLICDREAEIEAFVPQEYWSVRAELETPRGEAFTAQLTHWEGKKLDKLSIPNGDAAHRAAADIKNSTLSVESVEAKKARRNPAAPFITSTLQQEAARKLGFGASQTMRLAQRLYEGVDIEGSTVGLITYMRTDGTNMAPEAIDQARDYIGRQYGQNYLPEKPRLYTSRAKNAQEAHEAIRPTDLTRTPESVRRALDEQMYKLYTLIWKRTLACQMESAVLDQVAAVIAAGDSKVKLRATGSVIAFDGFLKVYEEGRDEPGDEDASDNDRDRRLPRIEEGEKTGLRQTLPEQHFTQPPPRFSEASLVKNLEELGIGRPSTYASILQVLQDRNYVRLEKKRFIPEDRGRVVTAFLMRFFRSIVETGFTAEMEENLDRISAGEAGWTDVLARFWKDFSQAVEETKNLRMTEVIDALNEDLAPHFFPAPAEGGDPRACPNCAEGQLSLKLGKFGAFIGCSSYPECTYTRRLEVPAGDEQGAEGDAAGGGIEFPKILGKDPETGQEISLRKGPYGIYVQKDPPEGSKDKPGRQGLPRGVRPQDVDLDKALDLLRLPREVGIHPETGEKIEAGIGRYGPYLKHQGQFTSLPKDEDVLSVGLNRAVDVIATAAEKKKNAKSGDKAGGRKAPAKKTSAKKTSAKKAPAKSTTAKSTAKKPAAKKTTSKKT